MTRRNACVVFGFLAWLIGLATVFSFNLWKGFTPLDMIGALEGKTIFNLIDYFTANVLMPLGAILIAIFVGWRMRREDLSEELPVMGRGLFQVWLLMIRVVVPIALLAILISGLR